MTALGQFIIHALTSMTVLRIGVNATLALLMALLLMLGWKAFGPITPRSCEADPCEQAKMLDSVTGTYFVARSEMKPPNIRSPGGTKEHPGVFEVTHTICSTKAVRGTLFAEFLVEPPADLPPPDPMPDGRPVERKATTLTVGNLPIEIDASCNELSYVFEVPKGLTSGRHNFRWWVEVCNAVRCGRMSMPLIEVNADPIGWLR